MRIQTKVLTLALASTLTAAAAAVGAPVERDLPDGWREVAPGGETMCARGQPYAFFVYEGLPDKVVFDFVGGGACWDAETCAPGSKYFSDSLDEVRGAAIRGELEGVYDHKNLGNPFREWTHVVVPYCTGDVHWGAADKVYEKEDGTRFTVHHRGAINARAALDWAQARFQAPAQVQVSGCSAGAYGAAYWAPLLAERYPAARLRQLGDAGVGVLTGGFMGHAMSVWNLTAAAPRWVPGLDPDRVDWTRLKLSDFYTAIAAHYPRATFAQFSTAYDFVQTFFYTRMGGNGLGWHTAMLAELDRIEAAAPNFRSFVAPGEGHCATASDDLYRIESDDVRFRDWLDAYANDVAVPGDVRCENCIFAR